jgi:hypothetical protein
LIVFNAQHTFSGFLRNMSATTTRGEPLGKDAPCRRRIERYGDIVAYPILGGLYHRYARI